MHQNPKRWQLIGFLVTCSLGTLLHFLYDWTGQSLLAAPFSGVNESTWEHMKLLYWPFMLVALVQWATSFRKWRFPENFWCIKWIGTTSGLLFIPVIYYTYSGCFGKSPAWLNISIFYISAACAFLLETKLLTTPLGNKCRANKFAGYSLIALGFAFVYYTFCPPELPLFQEPLNEVCGLAQLPI